MHRAIRAVPGKLDDDATARLLRHVDAGSEVARTVSQALGSTRWTARDRFRSTQGGALGGVVGSVV